MPDLPKAAFGVIFDMDGVLIDSEIHWKAVGSSFLQQLLPQWNDELQKSIFGLSIYHVYAALVEHHGLKISREDFLSSYDDLVQTIYMEKCNLIEGSSAALALVSEAEVPLALASSAPRAWMNLVVKRFSLDRFFQVVVSSDDVGAIPKPAPDIYVEAIRALQLPASRCIAIEDTEKGIQSASGAGARCIGLRNGFNAQQDLSKADLVLETFDALSISLLESVLR